jgi:MoaA/NifB/PqqE/SkfB family radical SAM enzyme
MWNGQIKQVHWEPTDRCNSACPMCPRFTKDGFEVETLENQEWTLESFKASWPIEFIKGLDKILSCGNFGDPCACREFVDIYEYIREINPSIGLACNTNGSLRNPSWWKRLGSVMREDQHPGNYCTFSLDGLEDTNHLYRRNTVWSKIMENAQAFIDGGGIAHWDYIVFEHNEHQVDEAKELARKMGFKNFNIKKTTRWNRYEDGQGKYTVIWKGKELYDLKQPKQEKYQHNFEDTILFKQSKYQDVSLEQFEKIVGNQNFDFRFVNGKYEKIHLNDLSVACRAVKDARDHQPNNEIFISAGGTVHPCCFLGSEPFRDRTLRIDVNYNKMVELNGGLDSLNMHKRNLFDIIQSPIFQQWIPNTWKASGNKTMMPAKCGSCCGVEFNALDFGELGNKKDSYIKENDK